MFLNDWLCLVLPGLRSTKGPCYVGPFSPAGLRMKMDECRVFFSECLSKNPVRAQARGLVHGLLKSL